MDERETQELKEAAGPDGTGRRERGARWSCVIEPGAVDREIDDGEDSFNAAGGATSREDEQRRDFLRRYSEGTDGPGLYRREIVADDAMIARLSGVKAEMPNGSGVISVVERAAQLSHHASRPLRVPPMIISGPPGVGKTRLARRIADVLGASLTVIDGGSTSDPGPITGNAPSYRGSGPGKVIRALLEGGTMSPVVLFDELEKTCGYHPGVRPLDALLPLLEPTTARSFTDEYVGLSANAGGVIWICTCNSVAHLPSPLLDRTVALTMPPLGAAELRRAVQRLMDELLAECGLPMAALAGPALAALSRSGLREARRVLHLALGPALAAGRSAPNAADIADAIALVRPPARRPRQQIANGRTRAPVGFVRFGS